MEQVIRTYGKFLLEAAVFAALVLLLFAGITDGHGNRGILQIAGALLGEEEEIPERADAECFREESTKSAPVIVYTPEGLLYTGTYAPEELFSAQDHGGNLLSVNVRSICSPRGENLEYTSDVEEIQLNERGIYTVCVSATDAGNRTSVCQFRIPVNGVCGSR